MNNTPRYPALRFDKGAAREVDDALAAEAPLHLRVNGEAFTTTMRTPGHDVFLARGLLFTEGILADGAAPMEFRQVHDPETGFVSCLDIRVDAASLAKPVAGRRSLLATSSCGVCGTRDPADIDVFGDPIAIDRGVSIHPPSIVDMFDALRAGQSGFARTGGSHGAAVFDAGGALLAVHEDIGRHNAVDKTIGCLLDAQTIARAVCLAVSGRLSYEIVYKAYRAGIPVLVAVGAASSMAVDTAARFGITLAAFCREGRATIYTHAERIADCANVVTPHP